eukprot:GFUD01073177.1.p1 GENE.GFUD01073177.1~~GFUD01073177.1.p1  ORF type:complete len:166 (+),score=39.44 GFUD01073177.1:409-906(+)
MFLDKEDPPSNPVSYPQLEWNYPPIRQDAGIGLDINSINYFSTNHVLAKDFLIFGSYDPTAPMQLPFCSSYFLTQAELENTLSSCQHSLTRRMKDTPKILYLVCNRQEWLTEQVVEQFTQLAALLHSRDTAAQLWDEKSVEECFNLQDRCMQLCRTVRQMGHITD